MITLVELVNGTGGELKNTVGKEFTETVTDSRKDVSGKIFFPLKGEAHDGHKFIADVIGRGVGAVVSQEWNEELAKKTTWIQVPDTLVAFQNLSRAWRRKWGRPVIGITGSNGKTSVKDFAHTFLSEKFATLKSEGSFNNHWGVPMTLLRLRETHEIALVEMGMNHAGEIRSLCQIAEPNIVAVNNVGRAHIEFFDGIEGIASAKEEIYEGLSPKGTAIFNLENLFTQKMHERWQKKFQRVITFGTSKADVHFELKAAETGGLRIRARIFKDERDVLVPIWGEHNVMNLACAAGLAIGAGVSSDQIFSGLTKCKTGWGRNQWVQLKAGCHLLFDGYNANPDSFSVLLDNLNRAVGKDRHVIAVFGQMAEQGAMAPSGHQELGRKTALSRVDDCYFFGANEADFRAGFESASTEKKLVTSKTYEQALALEIKSMLTNEALVVVKGSRGAALERVVTELDPLDFSAKY